MPNRPQGQLRPRWWALFSFLVWPGLFLVYAISLRAVPWAYRTAFTFAVLVAMIACPLLLRQLRKRTQVLENRSSR
jgi:hypothetical protein